MLLVALPAVSILVCMHLKPVLDNSTPSKAIESFLTAFGQADVVTMRQCLLVSLPSDRTDRFISKRGFGMTISELQTKEASRTGETVVIDASYHITVGQNEANYTEKVSCTLKDGAWRISAGDRLIGLLASVAGGNAVTLDSFEASINKARAVTCISNGKMLAASIVWYGQDNDEAVPQSNWIPKLEPYFKKRGYLNCPLDARGTVSYSINHAIAGKSSAKSTRPAKTVVLYEGSNNKLLFRHDGKAMVVFLDGHSEMVDANGQKELVWTLDVKPGKVPTNRPRSRPKR